MSKTYQARTDISINVQVKGRHCHIRFVSMTLGSSFFTTDDADVQQAIESHPKFGRQITILPEAAPEPEQETAPPPAEEKMSFYCLADAKEYLASRFGMSRTRLRTAEQIYEAAQKHHIIMTIE